MPPTSGRPRIATLRSLSTRDTTSLAPPESSGRARANTVHSPTIATVPEAKTLHLPPDHGYIGSGDIFETSEHNEMEPSSDLTSPVQASTQQPQTLDQLPIEIKSFTERFLRSLTVKAHATPLSVDDISELFQDFYVQAESHISTHISALTSKVSRGVSPATSVSSINSLASKHARTRPDPGQATGGDQQMLTTSEITDKRRARRMLELQRTALEEAVERGVCEQFYDKLYRHRSTDDEVKDAKLRSKTAALSLIGVGLKELHVNLPESVDNSTLRSEIYDWLAPARENLQKMDGERFPLGKLQHLSATHQSIVETLAKVFPSTSSADEVLPTLIYTLITSPPETLSVVSNLHFIQLFRAAAKVDGEAAYCLVNLEAAISFLETVDLSSLRTEEALDDTAQSGIRSRSGSEPPPPGQIRSLTANLPAMSNPTPTKTISTDLRSTPIESPTKSPRPFQTNQRRISHMIQAQAERIEAGRENFLNSADQAFDSINATLENSMKSLFGRYREQGADRQGSASIIPKTLEDARRLVKPWAPDETESYAGSRNASVGDTVVEEPLSERSDDNISIDRRLRKVRDVSADSSASGDSAQRGVPLGGEDAKAPTPGTAEAVGSFVNSLNPLSRFSVGVPGFAKFGRNVQSPTVDTFADRTQRQPSSPSVSQQQEVDRNAVEALAQLRKAKPPSKRFMSEVKDARDLKIGEVEDLLKDYRRLAELLRTAVNS